MSDDIAKNPLMIDIDLERQQEPMVFGLSENSPLPEKINYRRRKKNELMRIDTILPNPYNVNYAPLAKFISNLQPWEANQLGSQLRQHIGGTWDAEEQAIEQACNDVNASERHINTLVTLRLGAQELFEWPWELIQIGRSGRHLGAYNNIFLRYEVPGNQSFNQRAEPKSQSRVLVAWSNAHHANSISHEFDRSEYTSWVRTAAQQSGHYVFSDTSDVIPNASLSAITEKLEASRQSENPISVLHLACSGEWRIGRGWVVYLNDAKNPQRVNEIDSFVLRDRLMPFSDMLRLIVLCCDESSGSSRVLGGPPSAACVLHLAGFPAVVGFRYLLDEATARISTSELYSSLLLDLNCLEVATVRMRRKLIEHAHETPGHKWSGLQLFARRADGNDTRPVTIRPYPGLKPFSESQSSFFFGREEDAERIVQKFNAFAAVSGPAKPRLVVVSGASGIGKSSLAQAGTGPAYKKLKRAVLYMRAGEGREKGLRPLDALRQLLSPWLASTSLRREQPLLLIIDQTEELFASEYQHAAEEFLREVYRLAVESPRIDVLMTLRVDFQGRCSDICLDKNTQVTLGSYLSGDHYVFLDKPTPEQLRKIIQGPAHRVGIELESGLVETLLREAAQQQGNLLPLLGYTLDYLWERREGRLMTLAVYQHELEHLDAVLTKQAEKVEGLLLQSKEPQDKIRYTKQLQRLLVKLVNLHEGSSQVTRRVVRVLDVQPAAQEDREAFEEALSLLAQHRLVTISGSSEQTVELAHEALVAKWGKAQAAVAERREHELKLRRLQQDHNRAVRGNAESPEFLTGLRLSEARELLEQAPEDIPSDVSGRPSLRVYIEQSIENQRQKEQAEQSRQQEQKDKANFGQAVIELYQRTRSTRRQTRAALFLRDVKDLSAQRRWRVIAQDTLQGPILFGLQKDLRAVAQDQTQEHLLFAKDEGVRIEAMRANLAAAGIELNAEAEAALATLPQQSFSVVICSLTNGAVEVALLAPMRPDRIACSFEQGVLAIAADGVGLCLFDLRTGDLRQIPTGSQCHQLQVEGASARVVAVLEDVVLFAKQIVPLRLALVAPPEGTMARECITAPSIMWARPNGDALRLVPQMHLEKQSSRRMEPLLRINRAGTRMVALLGEGEAGIFDLPLHEEAFRVLEEGIPTELPPLQPILHAKIAHQGRVNDALFSPSGEHLLTTSEDGSACLWDVETGSLVRTFLHGSSFRNAERVNGNIDESETVATEAAAAVHVRAAAWGTRGSYFATLSMQKAEGSDTRPLYRLHLFDIDAEHAERPASVVELKNEQHPPADPRLCFVHDDRLLLVYSAIGTIWIVQTADGAILAQLPPESIGGAPLYSWDPEFRVLFSDPTSTLITCGSRQPLRLYRIHCFTPLASVYHPQPPIAGADEMQVIARDRMNQIHSVCFAPDAQTFMTSSADGSVRAWRIGSQHPRWELEKPGRLLHVTLDATGQRILCSIRTGASDAPAGSVAIHDRHSRALLDSFEFPEGVRSAYLDAAERHLLIASENGKQGWVRLIELATRDERMQLPHERVVSEAVFDRSGEFFLTACDDGIARLFRVFEKEPRLLLQHSPGRDLNAVCFVDESDEILTASGDGTAVLWDLRSGERRRELRPHKPSPLFHVAYHAFEDEIIIATADEDGNVRLWDAKTCECLGCIDHPMRVTYLAFDPSGALLATACDDGHGRVWRWREHTDRYLMHGLKYATQLPTLPDEEEPQNDES